MIFTVVKIRTLTQKLYFEVENDTDHNGQILAKSELMVEPTAVETLDDRHTYCSGILRGKAPVTGMPGASE